MDWKTALERNHGALLRLAGLLFALVGPVPEGRAAGMRRDAYLAVLRMLRPAESALRRLIVIAARGLGAAQPAPRTGMRPDPARFGQGNGSRVPAFALFDPRKRFAESDHGAGPEPRISVPGTGDAAFPAHPPLAETVDAARLHRRIAALRGALDDLPRQARRLARWRLRPRRRYLSPLRPGWPPGFRQPGSRRGAVQPMELLLDDCHALALHALEPPPAPP